MNSKETSNILNAIDRISESIKMNIITGQYKDARKDAELLHTHIMCHTPSEQFAESTDKSNAQESVMDNGDTTGEVNSEVATEANSRQNMGQSTADEGKESLNN